MATYTIPENAGPYRIVASMAGTPLVENGLSGKRKVRIPCKSAKQAEDVCRRRNRSHPAQQ
jgi:hypothetical protein